MTNPLLGANRLKLGVFSITNSSVLRTLPPEHYRCTWENSLDVARHADAIGFEAIVPAARFRSTVGPRHHSAISFENFTWTSAVAANTNHSCVMSTVHVTNVHPVMAAKAMTTIDHVSDGRFALNIVCGWFHEEAAMLGVKLLEHDDRYAYADEWISAIKRLWTDEDAFDFSGRFIRFKHGMSQPKPIQKPHPPLMNAGGSPAGRAFVAKHCDLAFVRSGTLAKMRENVEAYRRAVREAHGREIQVWVSGAVIQGDSMADAERLLDRYVEYADKEYIDSYFSSGKWDTGASEAEKAAMIRHYAGAGNAVPLVGDAAAIARQLSDLADVGIDGALLTWVDFQGGIRRFGREVMPLLERAGLRAPFVAAREAVPA